MKKVVFFALLVLTPLFITASPDRYSELYGVWEDYSSGVSLRIKPAKRNGLLVKRLDRSRNSRWRRYDRIGRRTFDDCDGNRLRITRDGLIWNRRNGRRSVYLDRPERRFRDDTFRRENDRFRRGGNYCPPPNRGYSRSSNWDRSYDLSGRWYCSVHDLNIDISYYDDGIRVRRYNDRRERYEDWYEYRRDRKNSNRYLGRNDRYYEWDDGELTFYDEREGRKIRFSRR